MGGCGNDAIHIVWLDFSVAAGSLRFQVAPLGGIHLLSSQNIRDFGPPPPSFAFHATYQYCCSQNWPLLSPPSQCECNKWTAL